MTTPSVNGVIPPVGETGSAAVLATLFAFVALFLGVIVALAGSPESVAVTEPETRASAVRKPRPTSKAVGPVALTTSTTAPAFAAPPTVPLVPRPAVITDCDDALGYLAAHQAPGFVPSCGDGSASGHYGYTCWNVAGMCPDGAKIIHIACPAPFVYMNEAHNSWTLTGEGSGIDPYGQGSPAEQAFCNAHR